MGNFYQLMNKNAVHQRLILFCFIFVIYFCFPSTIFAELPSSNHEASIRGKTYEKKILWGERFYSLNLNSLALKEFEKAHKINPGAYFPQFRIVQLKSRLHQSSNYIGSVELDFNKPGVLISALIFVILFSFVSMVLALFFVLFNRDRTSKLEKKTQFLKEEYQTMLINYLFSKEINQELVQSFKMVTASTLNRKILINQMIDLSITLTGEEKHRLKLLYIDLKLDKDSCKKARGRKWHVKAKGFRELAFMNIHIADDEIIRCLSSRNDILRMEAQFAMIRLNPDNSFTFLDVLEKKFTLWEQLNVYETITFHQIELPDFEHLLYSKNNSIVLFALRMIKVFKLNKAFNSMLDLLSHHDPEVRNLTIQVMGNLNMVESLPYMKKIYKSETYENCFAIIQSIASMRDESMLNFLKLVLDKEDDVQLQIEAAIAINKIGDKGSDTLNQLLNSDYKNYKIIVKHVLDKRIN